MCQLCSEASRTLAGLNFCKTQPAIFQYASPVFSHDGGCHMGTSVSASNVEVTWSDHDGCPSGHSGGAIKCLFGVYGVGLVSNLLYNTTEYTMTVQTWNKSQKWPKKKICSSHVAGCIINREEKARENGFWAGLSWLAGWPSLAIGQIFSEWQFRQAKDSKISEYAVHTYTTCVRNKRGCGSKVSLALRILALPCRKPRTLST